MFNESSTFFFKLSSSTFFLFGFGEDDVDNFLTALEVAQSEGAVDTGADKDGMDDEEEKVGEGEGTGAGESDEEEDEDKGTSAGALENEHDEAREVVAAAADGNGEGSTTTHLTLGDKGGRVDFSDTVVHIGEDGVSYMSVLP